MNTADQLIQILTEYGRPLSVHELVRLTGKSAVSVHKSLKQLVLGARVTKRGTAPRVYYSLATNPAVDPDIQVHTQNIPEKDRQYIDEHFSYISPTGIEILGLAGFVEWCNIRKLDPVEQSHNYVTMDTQYASLIHNGTIDATQKVMDTYSESQHLRKLYFLFPYSIPIFGKTRIAQWLFIGKQTQNIELMQRVITTVTPLIHNHIIERGYTALAFVPPTVPRSIQFMDMLKRSIHHTIPLVPIEKVTHAIKIQQKSLRDTTERIKNAESTFIIPLNGTQYKSVLIIDDFTGSGATLNVLAGMMQRQNISVDIDGLTILGSMNGFEVVKEL